MACLANCMTQIGIKYRFINTLSFHVFSTEQRNWIKTLSHMDWWLSGQHAHLNIPVKTENEWMNPSLPQSIHDRVCRLKCTWMTANEAVPSNFDKSAFTLSSGLSHPSSSTLFVSADTGVFLCERPLPLGLLSYMIQLSVTLGNLNSSNGVKCSRQTAVQSAINYTKPGPNSG